MQAELVRAATHEIDIKLVLDGKMHVLQWRRTLLWDAVLVDGRRQAYSTGLWGREKLYGLVFGRAPDGSGGQQVMLIVDPSYTQLLSDGMSGSIAGVRLEAADGPLIAYGTLDPKNLEKPSTFSDWMKKQMGMEW